jgi:hypothetical protein
MLCSRTGLVVCFAALLVYFSPSTALGGDGPIIAVFDIEERGAELGTDTLKSLTDLLAARLAECGYQVIPSDQIRQRILEKKKESYKECYSQKCQIELGKELAAQKVLTTQLLKVGNTCQVTATLFDLKKAAAEMAATRESPCREKPLLEAIKKASAKLCEPIGGAAVKPEEKEAKDIPRLVVMHPKITGVEVEAIDKVGLANLASSVIADSEKYKVMSQEDVIALLGQEQQARLLGCGDIVCMAEIGAAMGAPFLYYSNVGKTGETLVVSASIIDNAKVEVLDRHSITVAHADQVVEAMEVVTRRLLGQEAELSVYKTNYAPYKWTALGAGILGAILGGVGTGLAVHYQGQADGTSDQGKFNEYNDSIDTWNSVSVAGYITGGAMLVTAVVLFLLDSGGEHDEAGGTEAPEVSTGASPLPDGGFFILTEFRF